MQKYILLLEFLVFSTVNVVCSKTDNETYTAAVAELPSVNNATKFVDWAIQYMKDAKKLGAEIVVFPEMAIESWPLTVPSDKDGLSPCDMPDADKEFRRLCCAVRNISIYAVVNLMERNECYRPFVCPNRRLTFNTNAVIDRRGILIANHRKYHTFQEANILPADNPDVTIFRTDFGVKFGVLTCFEILFDRPTLTLIQDRGVKNVIINAQWSASLPYHIASSLFYGVAHRLDINMLMAGTNDIDNGETGSGIFRGKSGIVNITSADTLNRVLLIGKLYKNSTGPPMIPQPLLKGGPVSTHSLAVLSSIERGTLEMIKNRTYTKNLCHKKVCCTFNVTFEKHPKDTSLYAAYVFDGVADFQSADTGGTQSCLLLLCLNNAVSSCAKRGLNLGTFTQLSINGTFNSNQSIQYPMTVRQEGSLLPLQPSKFNHTVVCDKKSCANLMFGTQNLSQLVVFGVYGREFTRDGELADPVMPGFQRAIRVPINDVNSAGHNDADSVAYSILLFLAGFLISRLMATWYP